MSDGDQPRTRGTRGREEADGSTGATTVALARRAVRPPARDVVTARDFLWTLWPSGVLHHVAPEWYTYTGLPRKQASRSDVFAAIHPSDREATAVGLRQAAEDVQPFLIECRLRRKDGVYKPFVLHGTPITTTRGRLREWVVTWKDLSAIERALRAKPAARDRRTTHQYSQLAVLDDGLWRLVEAGSLGIFVADEFRVTDANNAFLALVGYTWEEVTTRPVHLRDLSPVDHADLDAAAMEKLRTRGACEPFEKVLLRSDGTHVPVLVCAVTITDSPFQWAGFAVDLTHAKAVETGLRGANERLTQAMQQMWSHWYALEEENSLRDALIHRLAHELGQPLSEVRANAQVMQGEMRLDDRMSGAVAAIVQQVDRLRRLVRDLLEVSRLDGGRFLLHPAETELRALVAEVLREEQTATAKHVLTLEAPEMPLIGYWDAQRLTQALSHVVSNAIKYSPRGGEVHVALYLLPDAVEIVVEDQGVGLTAEDIQVLLDAPQRLFRVPDLTGSGLGLIITRSIVEAHGGVLAVESPGVSLGATFTMRLPLAVPSTS